MDLGKSEATSEITALYKQLGSTVIPIKLEDHDLLMSAVLGLPHLVNHLFLNLLRKIEIPRDLLKQANGTSFRAQSNIATSIANEDPPLYYSILADNPHTKQLLLLFINAIHEYQQILDSTQNRSLGENEFRKIMLDNKAIALQLGIDEKTARKYFVEAPLLRESDK